MKNYVTRQGYQRMVDELNMLLGKDTKEALVMLQEAREKGDISENAEYDAAREYYDNLINKISKLKEKVSNSEIITTDLLSSDCVSMLSTVEVKNLKSKKNQVWTLVPENEIDIKGGKISFNSPIGTALMGKKIGEIVEVCVPVGTLEFKILDIKSNF